MTDNQSKEQPIKGWVKTSERLPDNTKEVFGKDDKGRKWTVFYTTGNQVEVDISDENDNYLDNHPDIMANIEQGEARLKEGWFENCEQSGGSYDEIFFRRNIVEWLDETPIPVQSGEERWISVGDRLPDLSDFVLVYDPTAVIKFYTAFYMPIATTEKAAAFTHGKDIFWEVTHWQPLPKPSISIV